MFTLSSRFRWVFCQLDALRHCLPSIVRQTLDELPETLYETYERVLNKLKNLNRAHAIRVFQCLIVAVRPLRVEELVEVLAVDFGDKWMRNAHWRWEDQEQELLSSCSSLIAIVESDGSRIVEFSHFSVKEFLTSYRLSSSSGDISRYHIDLEPAHIILARACMIALLRSEDRVEEGSVGNISPLARYAAEHWVVHAQFERVSLSPFLQMAMKGLFDLDRPYFAAWVQLYDIDTCPHPESSSLHSFAVETKSDVTPLYQAALCGFEDLVKHLIVKYPQHVMNTNGGYYVTPFVAALAGRHFRIAKLLHHKGAHANVSGRNRETPLHSAAWYGDLEMVQVLLDYNADVNARNNGGSTPLHEAAYNGRTKVVLVLLEGGANVGAENNQGRTPLHEAADHGRAEVVLVLLEHGANIGAEDNQGRTPFWEATREGNNPYEVPQDGAYLVFLCKLPSKALTRTYMYRAY